MVNYATSNMDRATWMSYKKFVLYISQYKPIDRNEFMRQLNSFQTIIINCSTGEWEIKKPAWTEEELAHSNLLKLNQEKASIKEKKAIDKREVVDNVKKSLNKGKSLFIKLFSKKNES